MSDIFLKNEIEIKEALSTLTTSVEYQSATRDIQQNLLFQFTDQISVKSGGSATILYSGSIDGQSSNEIVEKMQDSSKEIRAINDTPAAGFLNSMDFQKAYAQTEGLSLEQYEDNSHEKVRGLKDQLYHGKNGPWARISQRFVAETQGQVKILTSPEANPQGVFLQTELPELKKNALVESVNGHSKAQFDQMTAQEILQDAYHKRAAIQKLPNTPNQAQEVFKEAYHALKSTQNQDVSIEKTAYQQKQSSTTTTEISPKQQFSQMRTQQKSQTTTNSTHSLKNAPALKRKR